MLKAAKICLSLMMAAGSLAVTSVRADASAVTSQELEHDCQQSLQALYRTNPAAASLARSAKAVLIFPNIVKAGFVFGAGYGEGELLSGAKLDGFYNSVTASWGLQAGAQSYAYAVFLMTDKAVRYIHETHGWEIGVGPTVVIVDEGVARNLSTSTLKDDAYAFIFGQEGLMAGVSIEGTKITHVNSN